MTDENADLNWQQTWKQIHNAAQSATLDESYSPVMSRVSNYVWLPIFTGIMSRIGNPTAEYIKRSQYD